MKGCCVCEGRLEKSPPMSIEEIEEEYGEQMTEEVKQLQKDWLESRPPVVRAVAEKFQHPIDIGNEECRLSKPLYAVYIEDMDADDE